MAFEKGNTLSTGRPVGSLNKKTIIKSSLEKLNEIGITPLETSNTLIQSLMNNQDISVDQTLKLLNVTTGLLKYQLVTKIDELKIENLEKENEVLQIENQDLKNFVGSPEDLLNHLKKEK